MRCCSGRFCPSWWLWPRTELQRESKRDGVKARGLGGGDTSRKRGSVPSSLLSVLTAEHGQFGTTFPFSRFTLRIDFWSADRRWGSNVDDEGQTRGDASVQRFLHLEIFSQGFVTGKHATVCSALSFFRSNVVQNVCGVPPRVFTRSQYAMIIKISAPSFSCSSLTR